MTRAEAIDVLKHTTGNINWDARREEIYFTGEWVQAYEMAISALKEQDVTDTNVGNKWISVEEKLPEHGVPVLVADTRDGFVRMFSLEKRSNNKSYWFNGEDWWLDQEEITHWTPLPQPPKEDTP